MFLPEVSPFCSVRLTTTIGRPHHNIASSSTRLIYSNIPSETAPTPSVFVIITGVVSSPVSARKCDPVNSPLPLNQRIAAKHGLWKTFARRRIAVTPIKILGASRVTVDTPTAGISVMEFSRTWGEGAKAEIGNEVSESTAFRGFHRRQRRSWDRGECQSRCQKLVNQSMLVLIM